MEVLALGVGDRAELPGLVELAHGVAGRAERRRLVHLVDLPAALHGVEETRHELKLVLAEERRHGRGDVEAVLKRHDREAHVARRVGGDVDGLELVLRGVLDHLLAAGIRLRRLDAILEELAAPGVEVRAGHHLHVGMVLVPERRSKRAVALAGDAHAHLLVGERRPRLRGELAGVRLVEALDLLRGGRRGGGSGRREQRERSAKEALA